MISGSVKHPSHDASANSSSAPDYREERPANIRLTRINVPSMFAVRGKKANWRAQMEPLSLTLIVAAAIAGGGMVWLATVAKLRTTAAEAKLLRDLAGKADDDLKAARHEANLWRTQAETDAKNRAVAEASALRDHLEAECGELRHQLMELNAAVASYKTKLAEQAEAHREKLEAVTSIRQEIETSLKNITSESLRGTQASFSLSWQTRYSINTRPGRRLSFMRWFRRFARRSKPIKSTSLSSKASGPKPMARYRANSRMWSKRSTRSGRRPRDLSTPCAPRQKPAAAGAKIPCATFWNLPVLMLTAISSLSRPTFERAYVRGLTS